jgi:hypothetical protein
MCEEKHINIIGEYMPMSPLLILKLINEEKINIKDIPVIDAVDMLSKCLINVQLPKEN